MRVKVLDDVGAISDLGPSWDSLVASNRTPRALSAVVTAWFRHLAPRRSAPRVFVAMDGQEIVGILPLFVQRHVSGFVYATAGAGALFGLPPIVAPGQERAVVDAMASALAKADPIPDRIGLDGLSSDGPWQEALGAVRRGTFVLSGRAPYTVARIDLRASAAAGGGIAGRRSKSSQQSLARKRRRLEELGFAARVMVEAPDIEARLADLQRLYMASQQRRGGAGYGLDDRFVAMLRTTARELSGSGAFRLITLERPDTVIAAAVELASGGCTSNWLMGFDDEWARYSPGLVNFLAEAEHAQEVGDVTLDLGPGDEPYKAQWQDSADEFLSCIWRRRGYWPLQSPAQLIPERALPAVLSLRDRGRPWRPRPAEDADRS